MGWYETLRDAVFEALCASFGLDPDSEDALSRFVPAYTEGLTTPQANINADVCYYAISESTDTGFDYIDQTIGEEIINGNTTTVLRIHKTIPVNVLLSFYGPGSDSDAELFWSRVQVNSGYMSPRHILRREGITIESVRRPVSVPEIEGSLWRRRSDVNLRLNMVSDESVAMQTVEVAPEITIIQNEA